MSTRRAEFVRDVLPSEDLVELAADAKALTWDHYCEHAVIEVEGGRQVLVRGGRYGIDLEQVIWSNDPFGRPEGSLWVEIDGTLRRVTRLILHTHPEPTGPSDDDLRVLHLLGQEESLLFEINGPVAGTVIRPKPRGDS